MRVAVIQGGPSAEAEVSRASASGVANALAKAGHEPHRLELEPNLAQILLGGSFDVVFPVTHGRIGEDGSLQGMLEVLGLAYVGSGVLACAMAMDKVVAKRAFVADGLPVAPDVVVTASAGKAAAIRSIRDTVGPAAVIKPIGQGSAIGVQRVHDTADDALLSDCLDKAWEVDDFLLCERFVKGREITCAVVDVGSLGGLRAMPVTEIFSKAADWYDFASRYAAGGSVHECPAGLPVEVGERVRQIAERAHRALACRDLSRVDFVVGDGQDTDAVTLLEVNVIPGMTATSLFPEAASAAGIAFDVLCDAMVLQARDRASQQRKVVPIAMP